MRDVGDKAIVLFAEWIIFLKTGSDKFFWIGHNLFPDRVSPAPRLGLNSRD